MAHSSQLMAGNSCETALITIALNKKNRGEVAKRWIISTSVKELLFSLFGVENLL
jgi:hypothetical protein